MNGWIELIIILTSVCGWGMFACWFVKSMNHEDQKRAEQDHFIQRKTEEYRQLMGHPTRDYRNVDSFPGLIGEAEREELERRHPLQVRDLTPEETIRAIEAGIRPDPTVRPPTFPLLTEGGAPPRTPAQERLNNRAEEIIMAGPIFRPTHPPNPPREEPALSAEDICEAISYMGPFRLRMVRHAIEKREKELSQPEGDMPVPPKPIERLTFGLGI
jgi:hypothetical protein